MKPIWTGAIGFGLVNIPVKLYTATNTHNIELNMLDKKDHSPIKYLRINEKTGNEVPWGNVIKGYKVKDEYVVLDNKDFEAASPKQTKTIEISAFVSEAEISSIYYETPYFLEPEKSGERPYELLRQALLKAKKVGIASFVLRNRESLAVVRADENVIFLNKIRFHQEIRGTEELKLPKKTAIKPGELKMALSLVDHLTEKFDPSKYKDTYTEALLKLIKAKASGKKLKAPQMKVVHSKARDLMSQLKASLEANKKKAS